MSPSFFPKLLISLPKNSTHETLIGTQQLQRKVADQPTNLASRKIPFPPLSIYNPASKHQLPAKPNTSHTRALSQTPWILPQLQSTHLLQLILDGQVFMASFHFSNHLYLPSSHLPCSPPLKSTLFSTTIISFKSTSSIYNFTTLGLSHHIFLGYSIRLS
jgi:hypothetical protein